MLRLKGLVALGSVLAVFGITTWVMQSRAASKAAFTAEDYVQIIQLYSRYNHTFDLDADGTAWADTFTPEGAHGETAGRQALIEYARAAHKRESLTNNAWNRRHIVTSPMITPTPEGADGTAFLMMVLVGSGQNPPQVHSTQVYHDKLVKTKAGWRFKKREFGGERVQPAAAWEASRRRQ